MLLTFWLLSSQSPPPGSGQLHALLPPASPSRISIYHMGQLKSTRVSTLAAWIMTFRRLRLPEPLNGSPYPITYCMELGLRLWLAMSPTPSRADGAQVLSRGYILRVMAITPPVLGHHHAQDSKPFLSFFLSAIVGWLSPGASHATHDLVDFPFRT